MSTEAPVAPAAPAASPSPAPAASNSPAKLLMKNLADVLSEPSLSREEPMKKTVERNLTPDPKPAASKEATPVPTPAAPAKPEPGTIKVNKKKAPVQTPPPIPVAAPAPAPAPVVHKPAVNDDAEFEADLDEEERENLELARYAEKADPAKYAGYSERTKKFLKEAHEKMEDPSYDENDPAFQQWIRENLPAMSKTEVRRLERQMIEDRVTEKSKKEFTTELEKLRHENFVKEEEPKIRQIGNQVYTELAQTALPEEVVKFAKDKGAAEASKEYALEFDVAQPLIDAATSDTEEFHRLTRNNPATNKPLKALDTNNPQHKRILDIIQGQCEEYKGAGTNLQKDGKWFVTWAEWDRIPADQKHQFWTFTKDEAWKRALGNLKGRIDAEIKAKHKELQDKYGYSRAPRAAAPVAPAAAPVATPPPTPRPSPVPSGNGAPPAASSLGKLLAERFVQAN